jgi:hypothetical protein
MSPADRVREFMQGTKRKVMALHPAGRFTII